MKRRENRGAEGAEGGGDWGGGVPSPVGSGLGRRLCPLRRNFFDFLSGNGAFWCILGACFNVSTRNQYASPPEGNAIPAGPLSDSDENLFFFIDS